MGRGLLWEGWGRYHGGVKIERMDRLAKLPVADDVYAIEPLSPLPRHPSWRLSVIIRTLLTGGGR